MNYYITREYAQQIQGYCGHLAATGHSHHDYSAPSVPEYFVLELLAPCVDHIGQSPGGVWGFARYHHAQPQAFLGHAIQYSASVAEALDCFFRYESTITNAFSFELDRMPDGSFELVAQRLAPASVVTAFLSEATLATGLFQLVELLNNAGVCHLPEPHLLPPNQLIAALDALGMLPVVEQSDYASRVLYGARLLAVALPGGHERLRDTLLRELDRKQRLLPGSTTFKDRIERLITENIEGGISLQELCDLAGCSRRTLSRRLEQEGATFVSIREQVRRNRAMALIQLRDVPVKRLAGMCGFGSVASFNRTFTQWTGLSPAAFRKSEQGATE